MNFLNLIIEHGPTVIAIASAVAAATPTPAQGTPLGAVYKVVDLLALNVGRAKETGSRGLGQ